MIVGLIRFVAVGFIVCVIGYLALIPIAFGVAMMTQDDLPRCGLSADCER